MFFADFHKAKESNLVDGVDSVCVPLKKFSNAPGDRMCHLLVEAIRLHKLNNCSKTTGASRMRQGHLTVTRFANDQDFCSINHSSSTCALTQSHH